MSDIMVTPFRGPLTVAVEGWVVSLQRGLPQTLTWYTENARRSDNFASDDEGDFCFVAAGREGEKPAVVVTQRFRPFQGGFDPGVALLPDTELLFIGAGTRLLAYHLGRAELLWEDVADVGFWRWSTYPGAVLMSAELEFAAWDRSGQKLWSRFVEPPWDYRVTGDSIELNVMGKLSRFPISGD